MSQTTVLAQPAPGTRAQLFAARIESGPGQEEAGERGEAACRCGDTGTVMLCNLNQGQESPNLHPLALLNKYKDCKV